MWGGWGALMMACASRRVLSWLNVLAPSRVCARRSRGAHSDLDVLDRGHRGFGLGLGLVIAGSGGHAHGGGAGEVGALVEGVAGGGRVRELPVEGLVDVRHLLLGRLQAQAEADEPEEEDGGDVRVDGGDDGRHELLPEELAAPSRPAAHARVREDAHKHGAERAAHAVHAPHVESVVPTRAVLELAAAVAEDGGEDAHDEGRPRADEAGARRDRGESGDGAHAETDERRLAVAQPLDANPDSEGGGGGDLGVDGGVGGAAGRGEGRAAVEAEPAKPQHRRAQGHKGDVVRLLVHLGTLDGGAGAEDVDGGKGGEAGGGVDDDTARKVPHAPLAHPAAAPHPVAKGRVDEDDPQADEDEVRGEAQAVGEGSRHEGGGDDGEHALVAGEDQAGDVGDHGARRVRREARADVVAVQRVAVHVVEHPEGRDGAPEVIGVAEAEREDEEEPEDGDDAHRGEVLHHHRDHRAANAAQTGYNQQSSKRRGACGSSGRATHLGRNSPA